MSTPAYHYIDLRKATNCINVELLPIGVSLFNVDVRSGRKCVKIRKCEDAPSHMEVWRYIESPNGHIHSAWDDDVNMEIALIGNTAKIYGYFIEDFSRYVAAQHTIGEMARITGITLDFFQLKKETK